MREARALSLETLAERVGTTNQQISHLETGKRRLTAEWLQRLGHAMGCHPWTLVSDDLPSPLGPLEIKLLEAFRGLADEQRKALLTLVTPVNARKERSRGKKARQF
jgi:transcriptional regulator with XRE-family HTH domain